MAASLREQILVAIAANLTAALPSTVPVERSRLVAVRRSEGIVVVVMPVSEETESPLQQASERRLRVQVSILARGDMPDQVADSTASAVYAALVGNHDARTLDGLAYNTEEVARQFLMEDADQDAIDYQMLFQVTYYTSFADETVAA